MGLFSNKSDIARSSLNGTVSTYYEFEKVFTANVRLEKKTNSYDNIFDSVSNYIKEAKDEYQVADAFIRAGVYNLFTTMPTELLDEMERREFDRHSLGLARMSLKPSCPSPFYFMCGVGILKPNILKEVSVLIIKDDTVALITSAIHKLHSSIETTASRIKDAESGFFGEECSNLWAQLFAIDFRCKCAVLWFNYLNKQQKW